jgi:hypothetical protein
MLHKLVSATGAFRIAVQHRRKRRLDVAVQTECLAGVRRNSVFRGGDLVLWPTAGDCGSATTWVVVWGASAVAQTEDYLQGAL